MPVTECYEYEGKNVEQLAAVFLEKNINLSIISPRKIPVLFEIFEKSGGDLTAVSSKNYSKDPRHLVLLKGFSLKERPASPNMNQQAQTPQMPTQPTSVPAQQPPTPAIMQQNNEQMNINANLGMNNNQGMRPTMQPNIRQSAPMMAVPNQQQNIQGQMPNQQQFNVQGQQIGNFQQRPGNPQQQQPGQGQQRWIAPNQTRPPFMPNQNMAGNNMGMQGNMVQQQQQQQQNNMMQQQQGQNQNQPPQNSALISQLTQPPNVNALTPQQQTMARMAALQNQQQNQMMQGQPNPNMNMNPMQNTPQMLPGQQQQMNVQTGIMAQGNQPVQQQVNPQQMSKLKQFEFRRRF
jgi:mediator of RNA polymerase II transcription subunit 25